MEVVWSEFSQRALKDIFDYYKKVAGKPVAKKIKNEILFSTKNLTENPEIGQIEILLEELNEKHRHIVTGNYKIIYKITEKHILITDVFDTRQNPVKMNKLR